MSREPYRTLAGMKWIHALCAAATLTGCAALSACTGVRLVIDAVPASDELAETEVQVDPGASTSGGSKVALIDLNGLIINASRQSLLSNRENPVGRFAESFQKAATDSNVKAVILRINSPGGAVTASDIMYREVMRFREQTRKPVVILMADVAASGGYYVACAGDRIIAHPTTVTGSIGVIIQTVNVADGLNRIGVRAESITSGPNKNMGTPFEPMTPEHRALLQGLVDEFYGNFKSIVTSNRPELDEEELAWVTDGRVITGTKAAEVGLVDAVGDLHDAFAAAKQLANIQSARLVKYHRPLEFVGSAFASTPAGSPMADLPGTGATQINLLQLNIDGAGLAEQPGFYYLWDPAAW